MGCYFISDNQDKNCCEDIEGYWYQVDYAGYIGDTYYSYDPADDYKKGYDYNLEVLEVKNNVMYGIIEDAYVAGTFMNNELTICYEKSDNNYILLMGTLSDGIIYAAALEPDNNEYYFTAYSKDPNAVVDMACAIDIKGDWLAYEANMMNTDVSEISGDELTITEQRDNVFKGTMEQTVNKTVVTLDFTGIMTKSTSSGYTIGYAVCNDIIWTISANGESFLMNSMLAEDVNGTNKESSFARSYSRDGNSIDTNFDNLVGKSWRMNSAYSSEIVSDTYSSYGKINPMDYSLVYVITEQEGSLISGTVIQYGDMYDMVGYLYGSDHIVLFDPWTAWYLTGQIIDGDLYLNDNNYIGFCSNIKLTPSTNGFYSGGITGHWCPSYTMSSYEDEYWDASYSDREKLLDLEIFSETDNGFVQGCFDDMLFSGIRYNETLMFSVMKNDGTKIYFEGNFDVNGTIIRGEKIFTYSDGTIDIRFCTYSLKPQTIYYSSSFDEILGTWTSPEGCSVAFEDGTIEYLPASTLDLQVYCESVYGTLTENSPGISITTNVYGVMEKTKDMIYGTLQSSNGDKCWELRYYYDGTIILNRIYDTGFTFVAEERVFYLEPPTVIDPRPETREVGTSWTTTNRMAIDAFGNEKDLDQITLTIDYQNGDLISGTIDKGNIVGFRGYVVEYSDCSVMTIVSMEYPDDLIRIIATKDGVTMMTSYVNNDGISTSNYAELVEVTE